jgi:hypothetical protein
MLAVDAFVNPMCSPYATPGTISANLKTDGSTYRQCYSWLGPNQPGVNETDPSNPSGCVPDPGGAPPGDSGPETTASKCPAELLSSRPPNLKSSKKSSSPAAATGSGPGSSPTSTLPSVKTPPGTPNVQGALGAVNNAIGAATVPLGGVTQSIPSVPLPSQPQSTAPTSPQNNGAPTAQQTQQLLNYLLSP